MRVFYEHEFFSLLSEEQSVYINVKKTGYTVGRFNEEILKQFPRIYVSKFAALSNALDKAYGTDILFGMMGELVQVSISKDLMEATAIVVATEEEFEQLDKSVLLKLLNKALTDNHIINGLMEITAEDLSFETPCIVAKGKKPIPGQDAVVTCYELDEVKPTIEEKGDVDHYELNIINRILTGEWLGERIEPTLGTNGMTVTGVEIEAPSGKQELLHYDPKTVSKLYDEDEGKTILRARIDGAVGFIGESICVLNSIEVEGDVGFGTGNIEFNGFVDIGGSVEDNFSVVADRNIQIKGDMGVGAVELIESRDGDVYIRGGISGRDKAVIKARQNVFVKYANDCTIECEGTVNIGFYAMNCKIKAKEVVFESMNGKLIGGETKAMVKVKVGTVGSRVSTKTDIVVEGFDRERMKNDFAAVDTAIAAYQDKMNKYKAQVDELKAGERTNEIENKIDQAFMKYEEYREKHKRLQDTKKQLSSYLKAKGEGEVEITKKVYPNVTIQIKDKVKQVTEVSGMCSFYYQEETLMEE